MSDYNPNYLDFEKPLLEIDNKIKINEKNLFVLDSDTDNIIEYVDGNLDEKTKKYKFWELLK